MEEFQARIKATMDVSDVVSNVGTIQKTLSKLKLPDKIGENLNKNISSFYKEYEKYQKKVADGIKTQGDYNQVEKSLNRLKALYKDIDKDLSKTTKLKAEDIIDIGKGDFKRIADEISSVIKNINNVKIDTRGIKNFTNEIESLTKSKNVTGDNGILNRMIGHLETGNITEAKKELIELQKYAEKVATRRIGDSKNGPLVRGTMGEEKYKQLQSAINAISAAFDKADADAAPFIQRLNELQSELAQTKQTATNDFLGNANKFKDEAKNVEKVTDSLKRLHQEEYSFNRQAQDIDRQIQTYFGLSQMIRKVGDIARDAFNTVKELDAAMVETAVVTNFSVGDMWEMLPTYTKNANQLGSTIKDVYEAATLYYQQGLNQTQSMGLANETLKMARIGGLEAADATNMMTAALRGFNMELNQTSAQRINDVYSELAAITAADTKEIGSAMERTASIADSANMEFETTSAFLAQMIETTREAPENLGTAMKTIIARFQEMKQDPTKLVDSEGVAMDANRVDTALKTIGVNLTNTKGEFRDLDDVFLEISEKWDSLTQGQQRYIATIAAGARQQSRFIAMMQNYERVKELVDAANNSAGASQKQFEKTLTSMSAKLNRLKNAWDQFTMGLLNNKILKGAVDGLTGVFTVVNKIINVLGNIPPSPFEGITKSALTLVSTLGMLQFGKKAARGAIFAGAGWWKNEGKITENFKEGWGPRIQKERKESTDRRQEYWNRVKSRLTQNAKERVIRTPIDVETYLRKIDTSDLDVRVKNQIEQELDKIGDEPITEDVQVKINNIIDHDAKGDESLHITDDMVEGIPRLDQFEGKISSLAGKIGQAGDLLQQLGDSIGGPFGNALSTAGSLLDTLSITLEATATSFIANFTAELQAAAGADVNTAATLRMQVAQAGAAGTAKALGIALWSSLGPLMAIAAAIGVAIGAYKLLDAAIVTDKEQLEATNDAAAKASEAFDLANQELSELRDSISSVRENESAFDNLVVGTAAFNEQLVNANQQITELINKYPMLVSEGYVSTDKNGLMHISEQGLQAVEDYQKNVQARASAINTIQAADLAALENEQKAQQLYRDWGNSKEDHKKNVERAELLKQQAKAEKEVARQNAIRTTLNGTEVKNVEALSSVYLSLYDSKRKVAEQDIKGLDKNALRQQYADYHGYTYDQSTKKIRDVEGNEVEVDDKILKDEVIEQTVLLDFEENAGSLEKTLENLDSTFSSALGESFKNVEGADTFISDLLGSNIEANTDILKEVLGNPEDLRNAAETLSEKEIAAILGVSENTVSSDLDTYKKQVGDLLIKKASELAETQSQSYTDLAEMMAQSSGKAIESMLKEGSQDDIVAQIDKLNAQQVTTLSTIGKTLEENVGSEAMKTFINEASNIYLSGGEKTKEKFNSILEGISWESPTSRLAGYNEAINSSNKSIRSWGESMRSSADEANLLGESFDEFLGGDWGELSENADEFRNSMGEIDGAGILKASEQSKTLKMMLDSGEVSASGLAKALQGVEDGSISQVNSTVLQLLSSLNRLEDAAMEAHNIIENFDAGIDTGEGEDFVKENAEKAKEYFDNGEWGNQQLQNYIKLAAGTDKWNETLKHNHGNLQETTNDLMKYVTTFKDGFQPAWDQMISGKNINGKKLSDAVDKAVEEGRIDEKLQKPFKDFEISWDEEGFMQLDLGNLTTSELETYFQEIYGVSKDYAKLLMQDLANYDGEISAKLAANDLKETISSDTFKNNNYDKNKNLTLSNADVQSYATVMGYENVDEALEALSKIAGETVKTFDVVDEQGNRLTNYTDLLNNYAKTFFDVGKEGVKGLFEQSDLLTQGQLDAAKLISDTQSHGLDEEQSMNVAYEAYKVAQEMGETMLYNGMKLKDNLASEEEFASEIQTLTESSQWVTVGQTIGQQIVSALQTSSFLEQMRSGETAPAFSEAGFNSEGFGQAIEAIKISGESAKQQQQDVVSYLQQSQAQFANMNPEEQTAALQGIVSKLNELNFTPDQISSVISQGLGVNLGTNASQGGSLTGEQGQVKLIGDTQSLQTQLDGLVAKPKIEPDLTPFQTSLDNLTGTAKVGGTFIGFKGAASGQNNPNSIFHRTGTMARGSKGGYTISGRPTLTGEEGEELVWEPKQNRAYMVGSNGPQFANISKNAVVWNAEQTKRIKKNSGIIGLFGTGAKGITPFGTMAGGNAGGGSSYMIPGTFDVNAVAKIQETTPPDKKPEIPVKAKLEVEGSGKGGLLSKIKGLFGKGENGPSIKVTAEATKVTVPKESKTSVKVIGDITKLNNQAGKLKGVKATATVNKVVKSGKVSGEPVSVKAKASVSADTGKVEKKVSKVASSASKTQKMTIDANNGPAMNKVNQVINRIRSSKPTLNYSVSGPSSVTVPVYASFKGSWTKTVKINKAAKGLNNRIASQSIPQIGSVAAGKYGRLGPKGKGGLTLTGERGFEIAWLPSENRSMILGANGPQMVDLPKDAVVWTNEQSKKILKQKAIQAGSHGSPSRSGRRNNNSDGGDGGGGSRGGRGSGNRGSGKNNSSSSGNNKTIKKILQKAGKINLWWWNMTKKVEATQRKIDKLNKQTEKLLKQIGSTLSSIGKTVGQYITKLNKQISLNTTMRNTANKKLTTLNEGTKYTKKASKANKKYSEATERRKAAEKQVKEASKTKTKKDDKEAKKELSRAKKAENRARKKANKANKKARKKGGVNYSTISYEVTEKSKKKGEKKWKKQKKTKKAKINLAPYITYDPSTGAYQIDYNKINKKFGKNKSKAKAVGEAAQKKLEDYQGKKNTAEDNITKAQEALEQLGQQLYDTFFGWELELTKVWNITQKIEQTTAEISRLTGYIGLMDAQIAAYRGENDEELFFKRNEAGEKQLSDFMTDYINTFAAKVQASVQKIKQQFASIDASKTELASLADPNAKQSAIDKYSEKLNATKEGREEKEESKKTYNKNKKDAKKKKKQENQARKKMRAARKKANKKGASKKDKKAYKDAQKEYQEAKAKTKAANTKRNKSKGEYETAKSDYNTKVQEGTYYNKTDAVAYEAYLKELQDEQKIRNEARNYTNIIQNADGTISIDFNTDKFVEDRDNGNINSETAGRIQKYVQDLVDQTNDLNQKYADAEELLQEQYEALSELDDEWAGIGEELLSYYEEEQSKKIDQLKTLSDGIRDALKDLLDEVKTSLEQRRQAEDNAKTERDISKKQQQLAALRANTAGGNQVEIARLEKEIADAQQDYQRTLEDQLLEKLNSQAEVAEKQRAEMIELQQAVLEATNNAAKVNDWMNEPEKYQDEIRKAFYDNKGYDNLTKAQQDQLKHEFDDLYSKMLTHDQRKKILEDGVDNTKNELANIKESINTLIDKFKIEIQQPEQEENKNDDGSGNEGAPPEENKEKTKEEKLAEYEEAKKQATSDKNTTYNEVKDLMGKGHEVDKGTATIFQELADEIGWEKVLIAVKGQYSKYRLAQTFKDDKFQKAYEKVYGKGEYKKNRKKSGYKSYGYATGGLNKTTGPAWLDGTPSKPELVLNAQDTKNFMALRDILGSIMSSTSSINNSASTAMYEININVDHINNDYDVDKIAARVKKDIVKGAGYRNVTQVRNLR